MAGTTHCWGSGERRPACAPWPVDSLRGTCRQTSVTEAGHAPPRRTTTSRGQCGQQGPPAATPLPACPGPTTRQPASRAGSVRPACHTKPTSSPSFSRVPTLITILDPHPSRHLLPEANQEAERWVPQRPAPPSTPARHLGPRLAAGAQGTGAKSLGRIGKGQRWKGSSVSWLTHLSHVGDTGDVRHRERCSVER